MEIGECQVPDLDLAGALPQGRSLYCIVGVRDDPDYAAVVRPFRVASGEAKAWRYVLLR